MAAKRPKPPDPRSGIPVKNASADVLQSMADRAVYIGSPKHRFGVFRGEVGTPGARPTTVDQAKAETPHYPFTMICPDRWGKLPDRSEATALLRSGILSGQIGHPIVDGLPKWVWVRDRVDTSIVYQARRLSPSSNGYYAYPLTSPQFLNLGILIQ
jgi:hypothetical protein